MHRRLIRSFASVMGAAALVAAPMALLAPTAHAAPVVTQDHVLEPDDVQPYEPDFEDESLWEEWVGENFETDSYCVTVEGMETPFVLPEITDLLEPDEIGDAFPDADPTDLAYAIAVLHGAENQEPERTTELYIEPEAGHGVEHNSGENVSLILCVAALEGEPSTSPTPSKPPVVETDRVADTGSSSAIGVLAAGALAAGAGALVLSRRRQGDHR